MKVKVRVPFYNSELGLVKKGQIIETDDKSLLEFCEAGEASTLSPPRRGGKNGSTGKSKSSTKNKN